MKGVLLLAAGFMAFGMRFSVAADSDEQAWQSASSAASRAAYTQYLKDYPSGHHTQEAQLAMANLILAAPATGSSFDGLWQTEWTCPSLGQYPGYTYQFPTRVKGFLCGIAQFLGFDVLALPQEFSAAWTSFPFLIQSQEPSHRVALLGRAKILQLCAIRRSAFR